MQPVLAVLTAAAAVAALWVALAPRPVAGPDPRADLDPAPDIEIVLYQGEHVLGANTVRLSHLWQQRPVVLNFWAGLCPPCRAEMPDFQRLHARAGERFTLIGVDIGPFTRLGTSEEGRGLLRELGIAFPAGTTHEAPTVAAYKILGMPTTVFITQQGEIFKRYTGLLTLEMMERFVAELLAASETR
jgi:thiol-disulfide isomerase/thioredoxin